MKAVRLSMLATNPAINWTCAKYREGAATLRKRLHSNHDSFYAVEQDTPPGDAPTVPSSSI